jgi:glycosyltransferase involved in cell wall biosynthesis
MRIAFLLTQSLDSPSGLGRFGPLARELGKLGHQVSIFALNPYPSKPNPIDLLEGVSVKYVGPMHVVKQGDKKVYYPAYKLLPVVLKATWGLSLASLKTSTDVIYVCKAQPMNGLAGIFTRYLRGRYLCVDCDDYEAASSNFSNRWQSSIVTFFEKQIPRFARLVTTNTHFMKKKLVEWGVPENRIVYLPNGVDLSRFQNLEPKETESLRFRLGIKDKQVVAYIGSLSLASHPIELLLLAFEQLHARIPGSVLLLVGGGESLEILKQKVKELSLHEHVRFTGRVLPEDVPLYYHLASVTVDPVYDDETARSRSPLKLFESWASGIPFVSADVGDRRYLLGEPSAGLLARPGDSTSLADCLVEVLQNPTLGAELKQRGLARVNRFTFKELGGQLASAFEQMLIAVNAS